MPAVSVIIPVYNVEKYLNECLDSVINQTLKDIEIICVDDGSSDKSLEILKSYQEKDNRIKILIQQNKHSGVARNNGLKIAKGEYLSFLDSDDIFELDMLENMYNKAKEDDSDTVVCNFYIYDNDTKESILKNRIKEEYVKMSPFSPLDIKDKIFNFSSANAWSKLFKHSLFTNNNLKFIDTICCNDVTCVDTALALSKKISVIDKAYIHYRFVQTSNLTANRNKSAESFLIAVQALENNLKKFGLYDKFKKSFKTRMRASFNWELSICDNKQRRDREKIAKKILSKNLYNILYSKK